MMLDEKWVGLEDPQTRKLKSIASLEDDYRWPLLLEEIERKLGEHYELSMNMGQTDDLLAARARNHIIFRGIMKELREFPKELKRKFKEVE